MESRVAPGASSPSRPQGFSCHRHHGHHHHRHHHGHNHYLDHDHEFDRRHDRPNIYQHCLIKKNYGSDGCSPGSLCFCGPVWSVGQEEEEEEEGGGEVVIFSVSTRKRPFIFEWGHQTNQNCSLNLVLHE